MGEEEGAINKQKQKLSWYAGKPRWFYLEQSRAEPCRSTSTGHPLTAGSAEALLLFAREPPFRECSFLWMSAEHMSFGGWWGMVSHKPLRDTENLQICCYMARLHCVKVLSGLSKAAISYFS